MKQNTASQRVASELRARIRSGALGPGERLPSARQIVREWGVALATASKVLATLRRDGLVKVLPGIGTVVRSGERPLELSREIILHAAIALADDDGTAALSMRALAQELGVATMSLYRHVGSKEELLLRMCDAVLGEDPLPRRAKGWRAQLESLFRVQWAGYRRHPWVASALSMTRPQVMPNGMKHTDRVLAALEELGLPPAERLRTGVTLLAFVRGIAVGLESERQAEQDTGMTSDEWMASQERTFAPLVRQLPALARVIELPDVPMDLDALFECGLGVLLDGLEARHGRGPRAKRSAQRRT